MNLVDGPAVPGSLADGSLAGGSLADGKAPDALRTIGEVAKALGIRQHVLRYWEDQFPGLRPLKRSGGRRYYRPADIALVRMIDRLVHQEGYTLRGARKVLDDEARPVRRGGQGEPAASAMAPGNPIAAVSPPAEGASHTEITPAGATVAAVDPAEPIAGSGVAAAPEPARAPAPEPLVSGLRLLRDRLAAALAAA